MTSEQEKLVDRAVFEARICPGIPTDCCDYGVISHSTGKEVCRVWLESDARLIADLLNNHAIAALTPAPKADADRKAVERNADYNLGFNDGMAVGRASSIAPYVEALREAEKLIKQAGGHIDAVKRGGHWIGPSWGDETNLWKEFSAVSIAQIDALLADTEGEG